MDYKKYYEGREELTETQEQLKKLQIERQELEKKMEYLFKLGRKLIKEGDKDLGHDKILEASKLQEKWVLLDREVDIKNYEDDLEHYKKMLDLPTNIPYASGYTEVGYQELKQEYKEYKAECEKKLKKENKIRAKLALNR